MNTILIHKSHTTQKIHVTFRPSKQKTKKMSRKEHQINILLILLIATLDLKKENMKSFENYESHLNLNLSLLSFISGKNMKTKI